MLLNSDLNMNIDIVEDSLIAAKTILDENWLAVEREKRPSDLILGHRQEIVSPRQVTRAVREGIGRTMHPLAEAVLIGEEVVGHYRRTGNLVGSNALFRLCSLRDIARRRQLIGNVESRLSRLQSEQWESALYELLTAAAYSTHTRVSLIEEGVSPVPDLEVQLNPSVFIECKSKLQYEDSIAKLNKRFTREALGAIQSYLVQVNSGFLIRIEVREGDAIYKLPQIIQAMVTKGIRHTKLYGATIFIEPLDPLPHPLPHPMQAHSWELWEWMIGFNEWRDWHHFLPWGVFKFQNMSNYMVTEVQRPVLICFRSTRLAKSVQNIRQTLKDACRRQFKNHSPGILHVLVKTNLYGIGENATPDKITDDLKHVAKSALREYSRLSAVSFDLVTPPRLGSYAAQHRKLFFQREKGDDVVKLPQVVPVLLF